MVRVAATSSEDSASWAMRSTRHPRTSMSKSCDRCPMSSVRFRRFGALHRLPGFSNSTTLLSSYLRERASRRDRFQQILANLILGIGRIPQQASSGPLLRSIRCEAASAVITLGVSLSRRMQTASTPALLLNASNNVSSRTNSAGRTSWCRT